MCGKRKFINQRIKWCMGCLRRYKIGRACRLFNLLSESENWRLRIRGINYEVLESDDYRKRGLPQRGRFLPSFPLWEGRRHQEKFDNNIAFWQSCWDLDNLKGISFFVELLWQHPSREAQISLPVFGLKRMCKRALRF